MCIMEFVVVNKRLIYEMNIQMKLTQIFRTQGNLCNLQSGFGNSTELSINQDIK